MKLSVIVLNYNVRYFLELCLDSVQKAISTIDAEIIVIDNNSRDDSCPMVAQKFPQVRLIRNQNNVGFAKANNQAVQYAKGEFLCILNPDTVVAGDTFTRLMDYYDKLPNPGILGPRLVDGKGCFLPESKRNIPSPLTSFRRLFRVKLKNVRDYYADHINENQIGDVNVMVGAFLFMKRSNYLRLNGFDEDYFMYGEDIDLSYQVRKAGWQNYYLGTVPVIHFKGESTDRNYAYVKRFYGAMRLFYHKHFKSNWFFDILVSTGIGLVSLSHIFKRKTATHKAIDQYILISEDQGLLENVKNGGLKNVRLFSIEDFKDLGDQKCEVIFDSNYITYKEIIDIMLSFRGRGLTYKIHPPQSNYIVGSDQSDGKGEVITFKETLVGNNK